MPALPVPEMGSVAWLAVPKRRRSPPDDCGGAWGYEDLLKIIKNPKHEEHESMLEWLGGPFDPEAFDPNRANTFLRKLKWPHVTEGQLAAVLMERDGVGK